MGIYNKSNEFNEISMKNKESIHYESPSPSIKIEPSQTKLIDCAEQEKIIAFKEEMNQDLIFNNDIQGKSKKTIALNSKSRYASEINNIARQSQKIEYLSSFYNNNQEETVNIIATKRKSKDESLLNRNSSNIDVKIIDKKFTVDSSTNNIQNNKANALKLDSDNNESLIKSNSFIFPKKILKKDESFIKIRKENIGIAHFSNIKEHGSAILNNMSLKDNNLFIGNSEDKRIALEPFKNIFYNKESSLNKSNFKEDLINSPNNHIMTDNINLINKKIENNDEDCHDIEFSNKIDKDIKKRTKSIIVPEILNNYNKLLEILIKNKITNYNDFPDNAFVEEENGKGYFCPRPGCKLILPGIGRIKRHFITHINLKPHHCKNKGCDKSFNRRDNRDSHSKNNCRYRKL